MTFEEKITKLLEEIFEVVEKHLPDVAGEDLTYSYQVYCNIIEKMVGSLTIDTVYVGENQGKSEEEIFERINFLVYEACQIGVSDGMKCTKAFDDPPVLH